MNNKPNSNPQLHQSARKRLNTNLEQFPHTQKHKQIIDYLVYFAGFLAPLFTLPQVLKIWIRQSAEDISLFTWTPYLIFSMIWLWYGIIHKEKPIIFLNIGLIIVNSLIISGAIIFD